MKVCDWFWVGAPANLDANFDVLDGLFPRVEKDKSTLDPQDLQSDLDVFVNYTGVDSDPDVFGVIQAYRELRHFREFYDLASLRNYLGAEPVLTKVGFVKKTKVNPNTLVETVKTRIIVDSLESKVSLAAKRTHKSNLPSATTTAKGLVGLMNCDEYKNPNCDLDLLIADVSDAFWIVPLRKCERRFFRYQI